MTLKTRLALIVILLMSALVASYSLVLLGDTRKRTDAETRASLLWIVELLPSKVDAMVLGDSGAVLQLVHLVRRLGRIRHVTIQLSAPDGQLLAKAPSQRPDLPPWVRRKEVADAVRKDVYSGGRILAYFEVRPAPDDEFAEVWDDLVHSSVLVLTFSTLAGAAIVWLAFRAFEPVDLIRTALRDIGGGKHNARLPRFKTPEMDEIATAFNRMSSELKVAQEERQSLMRKLLESEEHTRRSVAHDLHDDLSPYLIALQPLSRVLHDRCEGRQGLDDISQLVKTLISHQSRMLSTLRGILVGLHPPELETMGLRGAIEQLVAQRRSEVQERVRIELDMPGSWQGFSSVLDASIYRMVRECLTNALRHSSGSRVQLRIALDAQTILIVVSNDGASGHQAGSRPGLGTIGMRDRCLALGGTFDARPTAQGGWQVSIRLPAEPRSHSESLT